MTTEQTHQHLHDVYKHLRHASTADRPEEIRERLRWAQVAWERHTEANGGQKMVEADSARPDTQSITH